MKPNFRNADFGLAVFGVGGCSIKVKDCSIRINYSSIKARDCFIRVYQFIHCFMVALFQ